MTKDWYEEYGFELEVIKDGNCRAYHKKGQKFLIDDYTTPEGICIETLHAIYPLMFAMRINGDITKLGAKKNAIRNFSCPSKVIKYKLERFKQCNNCGKRIAGEKTFDCVKKFQDYSLPMKVCIKCSKILTQK